MNYFDHHDRCGRDYEKRKILDELVLTKQRLLMELSSATSLAMARYNNLLTEGTKAQAEIQTAKEDVLRLIKEMEKTLEQTDVLTTDDVLDHLEKDSKAPVSAGAVYNMYRTISQELSKI